MDNKLLLKIIGFISLVTYSILYTWYNFKKNNPDIEFQKQDGKVVQIYISKNEEESANA